MEGLVNFQASPGKGGGAAPHQEAVWKEERAGRRLTGQCPVPLLLSETGTTDLVETRAYRMPYERNPLISLLPSGEKGVSSSTPLTNDNRRPGSLLPCRALFPGAPPHLHPHWTRTRRAGLGLTDQLPAHLHAAGPAWQGRCSAGRRALWRERLPGALGCSGESLLFSYLHSRTADGQPGHGPDASEQHLQDPQSHGPNFPEGPRDACVTREWGLPQKAWQAWLCPLSHVAPAS